jgi:hypothetical protein
MNLQPTVMAPEYKTAPKKEAHLQRTATIRRSEKQTQTALVRALRRCCAAAMTRSTHGSVMAAKIPITVTTPTCSTSETPNRLN